MSLVDKFLAMTLKPGMSAEVGENGLGDTVFVLHTPVGWSFRNGKHTAVISIHNVLRERPRLEYVACGSGCAVCQLRWRALKDEQA